MGRVCNTCKEFKPWTEYYKAKTLKHGYNYRCKECCKAYDSRNRERQRVKQRERVSNSPGGIYRIYTKEGSYIGQSDSIKHRLQIHKCPSTFRHGITKDNYVGYRVLEYQDDVRERRFREAYWIYTLKPKLNKLK